MKVTELLNEKLIALPLRAQTKLEAITALIDLAADFERSADRNELLDAVLRREAQRTTGIGRGFAIPHAKTDAVPRLLLVFGKPLEPIDFESIDGKPVSLIALLVSPTSETGLHLSALTALSRIVTNEAVFAKMVQTNTPAEFADVIRRHEAA